MSAHRPKGPAVVSHINARARAGERQHVEAIDCWCGPTVLRGADSTLTVVSHTGAVRARVAEQVRRFPRAFDPLSRDFYCVECGEPVSRDGGRCLSCAHKQAWRRVKAQCE